MKNLLLTLILFLTCQVCFSQTNFSKENLPAYYVQNNDTIGVILSVQQLQKLDYDVELLDLLKQKGIDCDSAMKKYVCVVNEYGRQVAILEANISTLKELNDGKDDMIKNLKLQVATYKADLDRAQIQLHLKDDIIKNQDKRISKLNTQKALIIGGGVLGTVVGFLVGFLVH